jgi:hypothetical protein
MLTALVVLLRSFWLLCSGHRAVALENLALRQQLTVFRRTVRRPHLRTSDRLLNLVAGAGFEPSITCFSDLLMARDFWSKRLIPLRLDTLSQFS